MTGFYGWPEASEKKKSWALLSHISSFVERPWCCIGDFNALLHQSEKQSRHPPHYKQIEEFQAALEVCELFDLGFQGYKFTWNNKRPGIANTRERLDRAIINREWKDKFSASTLTHGFSHASDHVPIFLQTGTDRDFKGRGSCGFKFEESWLMWDDCEGVVMDSWVNSGGEVGGLSAMVDKIKGCRADLMAWGSAKTAPATEEIKLLTWKIERINEEELTEESR